MQAIVLGAGLGRRLAPLTDERPKALIEVGGQPIMWWVIDCLAQAGVGEVMVVTSGYEVGGHWPGIKITEVVQGDPLGTADALGQVCPPSEPFLVLGCDGLFSAAHIRAVMGGSSEMVLSTRAGAAVDHSTMMYTPEGEIVGVAEKPPFPTSTMQSLLLYKLPPSVFDYLPRVRKSERGEYELQAAINMMIAGGIGVAAVEYVGAYFHLTEAYQIGEFNRFVSELRQAELDANNGE